MEFSSAGQLAAVKDAYGNAISITSDGSCVTAVTDGAGRHYASRSSPIPARVRTPSRR